MKDNTAVAFAHLFLGKGVHLNEVQRFIDASPSVDPVADTVPAPPPEKDGSVDPDEVPTIPCPRPPQTLLPAFELSPSAIDLRSAPEGFWDEIAELIECL